MKHSLYPVQPISNGQLSEKRPETRLKLKGGALEGTLLSQIIRLEGDSNYTWVYLSGQPRFLICKTLKKLEEQLPDFIRVHKGHLINPAFISPLANQQLNSFVYLSTGDLIPWSRARLRNYRRTLTRLN